MKDASVESARFEPTVFGAVRRYPIMVVAFGLLAVVAAVGYTLHAGKTYAGRASATVPSSQGGQSVDSQVLLMESPAVAQQAANIANATLHDNSLSAHDFYSSGGSVTIFPPVGAGAGSYGASIVGVTFAASSPKVAQVGANSLLQAFSQVRSSTIAAQYSNAIAGIDRAINTTASPNQRAALLDQRNQQLVNEQIDLAQQPTVAWAIEPTGPVSSGLKKTAVEGLVIGVLLGAAVAYVRASRRPSLVDRQDPAALDGVPLIGEIPAPEAEKAPQSNRAVMHELPMSADPRSAIAEAFRSVAGSVERIRAERGSRLSLVFVSPVAGVGKSMIVANLALAIAECDTRVLVVDADTSDGHQAARLLLGTSADGGLEQVLAGQEPLASFIQPSPLSDAISVLGPGSALQRRVTGPARSKAASALLTAAKSSFDVILIDHPASPQVADATELIDASDAAIIVLSPKELIQDHFEMVDWLKVIGSDVVGYIYNRATMPPPLARYRRSDSSADPMDSTLMFGRPSNGGANLSTELKLGNSP